MHILNKLSLPRGFSLKVKVCQKRGLGDESKIFLKTDGNIYDESEIWNYINVENSIYGVWQAYLLYKVKHILPFWWHGVYDSRTYIYHSSIKDISLIHSNESGNLDVGVIDIHGHWGFGYIHVDEFTNLEPDVVEYVMGK